MLNRTWAGDQLQGRCRTTSCEEDKDPARRAANFSVLALQRDWVISGLLNAMIEATRMMGFGEIKGWKKASGVVMDRE